MALFMLNGITVAFLIWLLEATPLVLSCPYTNQIFSSTLELHSNNCVVDSCLFINTTGNAIIIKDNRKNITIRNCQFSNITGYAILINSDVREVFVIGNKIHQVYGGIHIQASDYTITHNEIYQVTMGDAIKVGASGNINGNILYDIKNHGITYMNTKVDSNQSFIIENNMIYDLNKAAIYINSDNYKMNNIIIRFNTIIVNNNHSVIKSINVSNNSIAIYGNLLLNPDDKLYISNNDNLLKTLLMCNLKSDPDDIGDIGFVMYNENIDSNNYDLHISEYSWLTYGYCNGYNFSLPKYDIDGDIRGENDRIDVGADRIQTKQLHIRTGLQSGEWLFIGIVFAVFLSCVLFVIISAYHKHKTMEETYKNATTFVRPRTAQQTNKIMKMMIGDTVNENNSNNESIEMETERNTHIQSQFQIGKGNIKNLRTIIVTDETTNIDNEEPEIEIVYENDKSSTEM
eukprot:527202_1